jgi:SnoaL-like domain
MQRARILAVVALAALAGVGAWYWATTSVEGADVRRRLLAFAADVNSSATDGRTPADRAAALAAYFTDDIEVELGQGAASMKGRETILGIAERLQPRTAAFTLKFEDITVAMAPGGEAADVHLTAEFIRRSFTTGEEWLDAREFAIALQRILGEWRMARVTAIDTLK